MSYWTTAVRRPTGLRNEIKVFDYSRPKADWTSL